MNILYECVFSKVTLDKNQMFFKQDRLYAHSRAKSQAKPSRVPAIHRNTLQHNTPHCNKLQHTARTIESACKWTPVPDRGRDRGRGRGEGEREGEREGEGARRKEGGRKGLASGKRGGKGDALGDRKTGKKWVCERGMIELGRERETSESWGAKNKPSDVRRSSAPWTDAFLKTPKLPVRSR